MAIRLPTAAALRGTLLAALLSGSVAGSLASCAADPTLLESDIPVPVGMRTIRSADIRRSGGEVVGGRFLLGGQVFDAGDTVEAVTLRFESRGWTVARSELGLDHAEIEYRKDGRRVTLVVNRRVLEPTMSTGLLEVAAGAPGSES